MLWTQLVAAGVRLIGGPAVQLVHRHGFTRVEAIMRNRPALRRKLTAEQVGILEEAEAAQTDGVHVGVHSLIKKAAYMVYQRRPAREKTGARCFMPCCSSARASCRGVHLSFACLRTFSASISTRRRSLAFYTWEVPCACIRLDCLSTDASAQAQLAAAASSTNAWTSIQVSTLHQRPSLLPACWCMLIGSLA